MKPYNVPEALQRINIQIFKFAVQQEKKYSEAKQFFKPLIKLQDSSKIFEYLIELADFNKAEKNLTENEYCVYRVIYDCIGEQGLGLFYQELLLYTDAEIKTLNSRLFFYLSSVGRNRTASASIPIPKPPLQIISEDIEKFNKDTDIQEKAKVYLCQSLALLSGSDLSSWQIKPKIITQLFSKLNFSNENKSSDEIKQEIDTIIKDFNFKNFCDFFKKYPYLFDKLSKQLVEQTESDDIKLLRYYLPTIAKLCEFAMELSYDAAKTLKSYYEEILKNVKLQGSAEAIKQAKLKSTYTVDQLGNINKIKAGQSNQGLNNNNLNPEFLELIEESEEPLSQYTKCCKELQEAYYKFHCDENCLSGVLPPWVELYEDNQDPIEEESIDQTLLDNLFNLYSDWQKTQEGSGKDLQRKYSL